MSSSATGPALLMEGRICFVRGQKVMLDADLADLHQVSLKSLNLAVRRNRSRFPEDFMFQLAAAEADRLRLPAVPGLRSSLPHVFTEQGIAMLSSVLQSKRAIELSIAIMRELAQNGDKAWLRALDPSPATKRRGMGALTSRAGAVNEY